MAAPTHNPSRRAVLGAAVALPLLDGSFRHCEERSDAAIQRGGRVNPGLLPPDQARGRNDEWNRALAAFDAAAVEMRAYEALCSGRSFAEQEALQDGYDALGEAMEAALGRLLGVPAPDVAALARKIELAFAHEIEPLSDGAPGLAAIRRDALRLAGSGTVS